MSHRGNILSPEGSNHMVQFSGLFANYTYYQRSTEIFNFCRHLYHSYHYKSLYKGFPNTTAIGFSLSFFLCFTRVFTIEMWHTNKNSICGDYVPLSLLFQDLKRPCNYFFFFIKAQFLTVKKSLEIYLLIFINLTVAVFSFIPRLIGYEDLQAICSYLFRATYIYFPFFFFPCDIHESGVNTVVFTSLHFLPSGICIHE